MPVRYPPPCLRGLTPTAATRHNPPTETAHQAPPRNPLPTSIDKPTSTLSLLPTVHAQGSFIYLQLWALGRAAKADTLAKEGPGYDVVSASDVPFEGGDKPRPLSEADIARYVGHYAAAAKAFVERAGGDGVESQFQSQLAPPPRRACANSRSVCSPRSERVPD